MAPVHTTVTIQAFTGLGPGMVGDFCVHTQKEGGGGGLIERHVHLLETKTYSPGEDMYVS